MLQGLLYRFLLKAILIALVALVLYGVFPGTSLVVILMLVVVSRLISIVSEALRRPGTEGQCETMGDEVTGPRSKRELVAEVLGLVAFVFLIPFDIALYTRDIVSVRSGQGWEGAIVALLCVGLYAWPHWGLKSQDHSDFRIWWWTLSFALALLPVYSGVETRHPYLDPFNPNHDRLAAERVLSLKNNVTAGGYSDWVLRYARQLDERGESEQAIHFYREALRLDANERAAFARLGALEARRTGDTSEKTARPSVASSAPYWTARNPVTPRTRRQINRQLEDVEECTVIVAPIGEMSDEILDAVGFVIQNELNLPVFISPDAVPLPPHTRVPGLAVGPQWDQSSLVQAFTNSTKNFPRAPIKYVLLTSVDIYRQDANFLFSANYAWGALVSTARFGGVQSADHNLMLQRTAKQALCALLKSFNVPVSPDRKCVTSYTRRLDEFDSKGNRPNAETPNLFRQAVRALNLEWQSYRASRSP